MFPLLLILAIPLLTLMLVIFLGGCGLCLVKLNQRRHEIASTFAPLDVHLLRRIDLAQQVINRFHQLASIDEAKQHKATPTQAALTQERIATCETLAGSRRDALQAAKRLARAPERGDLLRDLNQAMLRMNRVLIAFIEQSEWRSREQREFVEFEEAWNLAGERIGATATAFHRTLDSYRNLVDQFSFRRFRIATHEAADGNSAKARLDADIWMPYPADRTRQ